MAGPSGTALVTFIAQSGAPTVEPAAGILDLPADALDADFGVVTVKPDEDVYAVLVGADRLPDVAGPADVRVYANPSIEALDATLAAHQHQGG